MIEIQNIKREVRCLLNRILSRGGGILKSDINGDRLGWQQFMSQLLKNFLALFTIYAGVYNERYDFFFYLEHLIASIANLWFSRPNTTFQQSSLS